MSIQHEKEVVQRMITIYCHKKHNSKKGDLCPQCTELLRYAHQRLDHCPYGDNKLSCRRCKTHCYKLDMRERIRAVMRYVGPRMIFYAPIEAIKHWLPTHH